MPGENDAAAEGASAEVDLTVMDPPSFGDDQLPDLLNFDPFQDKGEAADAASSDADAGEAGAEAGSVEGETSSDAKAGVETPETSTDEGQVTQQVAEVPDSVTQELTQLRGMVAQLTQAQQPTQETPAQETPAAEPDFAFTIPNELQTMLNSDNAQERAQGLSAFAKGIAQSTYQAAVTQVATQMQNLPQIVQQQVAETQQRERVARDFYNSHPDLANEALAPVVLQVAKQVVTEQGHTSWNSKLRDETATRVRTLLKMQAPKKSSAPRPPATVPSKSNGARTAVTPSTSQTRSMEDMVFGSLNSR